MEFAAGALGWSEPTFWATSLRFWDRAIAGYRKANGLEPSVSEADVRSLKALMAEYPATLS